MIVLILLLLVLVLAGGLGWVIYTQRDSIDLADFGFGTPAKLNFDHFVANPPNQHPKAAPQKAPPFRKVRVTGETNVSLPTHVPKAGAKFAVCKGKIPAQVVKSERAPCWITGLPRTECTCKECTHGRK